MFCVLAQQLAGAMDRVKGSNLTCLRHIPCLLGSWSPQCGLESHMLAYYSSHLLSEVQVPSSLFAMQTSIRLLRLLQAI